MPVFAQSRLVWDAKTQGAFVTCMAKSSNGDIWAGTEDNGAWRWNASTQQWTQFTTKDGLGDNDIYAVAVDKQNRVWIGHLNHGVSVWNGASWKNYDVFSGPTGERIFDIAVCPTDGDVWIASNSGLSRYSVSKDTWSNYSRASGLPSDQVNSLAFDTNGDLYAGTLCDGIAMARTSDNYKTWQNVRGSDELSATDMGDGLPSSLINDVLVASDGAVYVATTSGLAWSRDKGKTWRYSRGSDWLDKNKGRWKPAKVAADAAQETLLLQDDVTTLAEDARGFLWLGLRQQGYQVLSKGAGQIVYYTALEPGGAKTEDFVSAILPLPDSSPLIARYGGETAGISVSARPFKPAEETTNVTVSTVTNALHPKASTPLLATLQGLLKRVKATNKPLNDGEGLFLGSDWSTQGDWTGRYGRETHELCGAFYEFTPPERGYKLGFRIGPHNKGEGSLYTYSFAPKTDNPRVLYVPPRGHRTQSELNDASWQSDKFPLSWEGPDMWVSAEVPNGVHRISLHFYNKDGHDGANRYRDYLLQLKPHRDTIEESESAPTLAQSRVRDFWGSVYHNFVVKGPGKYRIKIGRNHSHATILQGVFIDKLTSEKPDKEPFPYLWLAGISYQPPTPPALDDKASETLRTAVELWQALDDALPNADSYPLQRNSRVLALRAAVAENAPPELLANWRWNLNIWTEADRGEFTNTMAKAHVALKAKLKEQNQPVPE